MANTGPFMEDGNSGLSSHQENASPATKQSDKSDGKPSKKRYPEMQSAKRFPIKLPLSVKGKAGESHAETANISANGVLFQVVDAEMPVGSMVDFTISLPADVVGATVDVRLDCRGRVVRNFEDSGRRGVGVVIDEYRFDRR